DEKGHRLGVCQVPHSLQGLSELTDEFTAISGPDRKAEMAGIIATNHGLLRSALLEADFSVYPKTVEHKHSALGAKTDRIDASLLAKQCPGQNALCYLEETRMLSSDDL